MRQTSSSGVTVFGGSSAWIVVFICCLASIFSAVLCRPQNSLAYQPASPSYHPVPGDQILGQIVPPGQPWPASPEGYQNFSQTTSRLRPNVASSIASSTTTTTSIAPDVVNRIQVTETDSTVASPSSPGVPDVSEGTHDVTPSNSTRDSLLQDSPAGSNEQNNQPNVNPSDDRILDTSTNMTQTRVQMLLSLLDPNFKYNTSQLIASGIIKEVKEVTSSTTESPTTTTIGVQEININVEQTTLQPEQENNSDVLSQRISNETQFGESQPTATVNNNQQNDQEVPSSIAVITQPPIRQESESLHHISSTTEIHSSSSTPSKLFTSMPNSSPQEVISQESDLLPIIRITQTLSTSTETVLQNKISVLETALSSKPVVEIEDDVNSNTTTSNNVSNKDTVIGESDTSTTGVSISSTDALIDLLNQSVNVTNESSSIGTDQSPISSISTSTTVRQDNIPSLSHQTTTEKVINIEAKPTNQHEDPFESTKKHATFTHLVEVDPYKNQKPNFYEDPLDSTKKHVVSVQTEETLPHKTHAPSFYEESLDTIKKPTVFGLPEEVDTHKNQKPTFYEDPFDATKKHHEPADSSDVDPYKNRKPGEYYEKPYDPTLQHLIPSQTTNVDPPKQHKPTTVDEDPFDATRKHATSNSQKNHQTGINQDHIISAEQQANSGSSSELDHKQTSTYEDPFDSTRKHANSGHSSTSTNSQKDQKTGANQENFDSIKQQVISGFSDASNQNKDQKTNANEDPFDATRKHAVAGHTSSIESQKDHKTGISQEHFDSAQSQLTSSYSGSSNQNKDHKTSLYEDPFDSTRKHATSSSIEPQKDHKTGTNQEYLDSTKQQLTTGQSGQDDLNKDQKTNYYQDVFDVHKQSSHIQPAEVDPHKNHQHLTHVDHKLNPCLNPLESTKKHPSADQNPNYYADVFDMKHVPSTYAQSMGVDPYKNQQGHQHPHMTHVSHHVHPCLDPLDPTKKQAGYLDKDKNPNYYEDVFDMKNGPSIHAQYSGNMSPNSQFPHVNTHPSKIHDSNFGLDPCALTGKHPVPNQNQGTNYYQDVFDIKNGQPIKVEPSQNQQNNQYQHYTQVQVDLMKTHHLNPCIDPLLESTKKHTTAVQSEYASENKDQKPDYYQDVFDMKVKQPLGVDHHGGANKDTKPDYYQDVFDMKIKHPEHHVETHQSNHGADPFESTKKHHNHGHTMEVNPYKHRPDVEMQPMVYPGYQVPEGAFLHTMTKPARPGYLAVYKRPIRHEPQQYAVPVLPPIALIPSVSQFGPAPF